jgi:hypothetical protein
MHWDNDLRTDLTLFLNYTEMKGENAEGCNETIGSRNGRRDDKF